MRRLCLLLGMLLAGSLTRADIANPDVRPVRPRMAFPGVEKHPDHVFLLHVRDKSYWGPSAEPVEHVIPIPGPEPFQPDIQRYIESMVLLAVPRRTFDTLDADDRQALAPGSAGVLSHELRPPATSRSVREPEPAPVVHRVAIVAGKLAVEPVEAAPGAGDSSGIGGPAGRHRIAWGMALAASVAWLGIAFSRRFSRPGP